MNMSAAPVVLGTRYQFTQFRFGEECGIYKRRLGLRLEFVDINILAKWYICSTTSILDILRYIYRTIAVTRVQD